MMSIMDSMEVQIELWLKRKNSPRSEEVEFDLSL